MDYKLKIFIAGHGGMVGSAISRCLRGEPSNEIITRSSSDLDLRDQAAVGSFFHSERPDQVYLAAAKVGGIHANNVYPAEFLYENLMIQTNVIHQAFRFGIKKLLFLGSSCIYPKLAQQPIDEDALLTGRLEETNEPYAIAKIAGIKLCESYNRQYGRSRGIDYRSIMPSNLYGPGDNYHPENSHVIPALIRRFHEAKIENRRYVTIWGTGSPRREFLHVDDLASAAVFIMNLDPTTHGQIVLPMQNHINVGSGSDISIKELAVLVADVVGYQGDIHFDASKPDGVQRKLLNSAKLRSLGWSVRIPLENGLERTYRDFLTERLDLTQ
jgi:GDP-L-fucose synthase